MKNNNVLTILNSALFAVLVVCTFFLYLSFNPHLIQGLVESPYMLFLPLLLPQWVLLFLLYRSKRKLTWRPIYLMPIVLLQSISILCMQSFAQDRDFNIAALALNFTGHSLVHLSIFTLFAISAYALGDVLLKFKSGDRPWLKVGVGIIVQVCAMSIIGIWFGLSFFIVAPFILIPLLIGIKKWPGILSKGLFKTRKIVVPHVDRIFLYPLIWLALGFSLAAMIKPMAIGHDGNSLYLYLSKQIATGFPFPKGGYAYPWSVYMSLPEILTGIHSTIFFFSHIFGFICLHLLHNWSKKNVSGRFATWQTTLLSMSPFLIFHLVMDEKVDLGGLFFVLIALFYVLEGIKKKTDNSFNLLGKAISPLVLISVLLLFAVSIKYSNVYFIIGMVCTYLLMQNYKWATTGLLLGSIGLLQYLLKYPYEELHAHVGVQDLLSYGLMLLGGAVFIFDLTRKRTVSRGIPVKRQTVALTFCAFIFIMGPWMLKNGLENNSVHPKALYKGQEGMELFDIPVDYEKPKSWRYLDWLENQAEAEPMSYRERPKDQLDQIEERESLRYMGLESGAAKWLSLPVDILFNSNTPKNPGNHLGVLPFLLLVFLLRRKLSSPRPIYYTLTLVLTFVWLILGVGTNIIHQKDFVNTLGAERSIAEWAWSQSALFNNDIITGLTHIPEDFGVLIILGLSAIFLYQLQHRHKKSDVYFLRNAIAIPGLLWLLSGSGIMWYILPTFFLVYAFLFPDKERFELIMKSRWVPVIAGSQILIFLASLSSTIFPEQPKDLLIPKMNIEYSSDLSALGTPPEKTIPSNMQSVLREINRSNANIYMINTPFRYFIDQKNRTIVEDDYLGTYWGMQKQLKDLKYFPEVLAHNNFEYLIYEITTPNRAGVQSATLNERCTSFLQVVASHPQVDLMLTNNFVEDQDGTPMRLNDGRTVKGKPGIIGKTVILGSYAIFKIRKK